jgi:putative tryptophan/tyrosine transport system substrate-binding protein
MRRREFIAGLAGSVGWPALVLAQQPERARRVGLLMALAETDPEAQAQLLAFVQGLAALGWIANRNIQMDIRWAAGSADRARVLAKELVGLQPDAIFADSTAQAAALHEETRTIPVVFVLVADPIGLGLVAGLPRPGGNFTGFMPHEPGMARKWLELLTEIAPGVTRVAIIFNPDTTPYIEPDYLPQFETAAQFFKVTLLSAPVRSDAEIETVITSLASYPGGGIIAAPGSFMNVHRSSVISLSARSNIPTVYTSPIYVRDGGLLSYGPDLEDIFRRAAPYVDRVLRGTSPTELPVQLPVKFHMGLNARAAKALGLNVPQSILLRADEVIE